MWPFFDTWHKFKPTNHPQLHGDPWTFPRVLPDKALTSIQSFPHTLTSVSREVVQGSRSRQSKVTSLPGSQAFKTTSGWIKMTETCHPKKNMSWVPTSGWWILMGDLLTYPLTPPATYHFEMFILQVARLIWIHRCLGASSTSILVLWDINQPQLEISRVKKPWGRFWFQQ